MTAWGWVLIGVGSFVTVSLLVAFALARILGTIANEVTELVEQETWASAPLTRADDWPEGAEAPEQPVAPTRHRRRAP